MTVEILEEGIALKATLDYYNSVYAELNDGDNKVETLINFISTGNTAIPAGAETTFVNTLRDALVAAAVSQLDARIETLQGQFDSLGEEPAP